MAKIMFFTERLPPDKDLITEFSFSFMKSLAQQQNEVRVLSTYSSDPRLNEFHVPELNSQQIEIIRPFRSWSWHEVPRIIPLITAFNPDILHFIQPRYEAMQGFTNATHALSALPRLLPRAPRIVTSFFEIRREDLARQLPLLWSSDALTASHPALAKTLEQYLTQNLAQNTPQNLAKKLTKKSRLKPLIEVISAPLLEKPLQNFAASAHAHQQVTEAMPESLIQFMSQFTQLIFIPGEISRLEKIEEVFELVRNVLQQYPNVGIIFGGTWGSLSPIRRRDLMNQLDRSKVGGRVLITGPLSSSSERECLGRCHIIFAAAMPFESLHFFRVIRLALATDVLPVISAAQALYDSLPWGGGEHHSIVAPDQPNSWGPALAQALLRVSESKVDPQRSQEMYRRDVQDLPVNQLNRLYTRLLSRE